MSSKIQRKQQRIRLSRIARDLKESLDFPEEHGFQIFSKKKHRILPLMARMVGPENSPYHNGIFYLRMQY